MIRAYQHAPTWNPAENCCVMQRLRRRIQLIDAEDRNEDDADYAGRDAGSEKDITDQ